MAQRQVSGWRTWLRWEFGRRIEVTGFIKLIIAERLTKATLLISVATGLLVVNDSVIPHWTTVLQDQLNLNPGQAFFRRVVERTLVSLGHLSAQNEVLLATGAYLYGALEAFEAVGLLLRKRWAEYLVLLATGAFLPWEIAELAFHPSLLKALFLLVNIAIVAYLIWRKRLFLERPGQPVRADR